MHNAGSDILPGAAGYAGCLTGHLSKILFLLAGNRLRWTFAGPRIGVRTLTANRQAFTVTQTTITP
jgi:hypothetical protein